MKYLSGAAMLPKRVGEPSARPTHSSRSRASTYGAPSAGTGGAGLSMTGATLGTVRRRACMPSTLSTPRASACASVRTDPVAL
jgi:hypothetical protein